MFVCVILLTCFFPVQAVAIAEAECVTMAAELAESALFEVAVQPTPKPTMGDNNVSAEPVDAQQHPDEDGASSRNPTANASTAPPPPPPASHFVDTTCMVRSLRGWLCPVCLTGAQGGESLLRRGGHAGAHRACCRYSCGT